MEKGRDATILGLGLDRTVCLCNTEYRMNLSQTQSNDKKNKINN